jgi:hypothetical protein
MNRLCIVSALQLACVAGGLAWGDQKPLGEEWVNQDIELETDSADGSDDSPKAGENPADGQGKADAAGSSDASADKQPRDGQGRPHGVWVSYHANGKEKLRTRYVNGEKTGRETLRDEQGRLVYSRMYRLGQAHGVEQIYRDGELVAEPQWALGRMIFPSSRRFVQKSLGRINTWKPPADVADKQVYNAETLEGLRLVMMYRFLAGVPWEHLRLDAELTRYALAGAKLCARIGRLDHHPGNPGMDEKAFETAYTGTSRSNLHMSGRGARIPYMVHSLMDDSDARNIDRVGHRRWILNSRMGKTGLAVTGKYGAMYAMDISGPEMEGWPEGFDFDIVAFPRGYFPARLLEPHMAWHVTPNPQKYTIPNASSLTIAVRPIKPGEAGAPDPPDTKPLPVDAVAVSRKGVGDGTAIILRPRGLPLRPGMMVRVTITGLQKNGQPATIDYIVALI